MKKLKNRFLSYLLSAAMIISMVPSALASGIDAQPLARGRQHHHSGAVHHNGSDLCYGTGNGV